MNNVLTRIEDLRLRSGLNKAMFAKKIGVVPLTISNWIKSDTIPSLSIIERVCQVAGITVEQFFSDSELLSKNGYNDKFLYQWRTLNDREKELVNSIVDLLINKNGE